MPGPWGDRDRHRCSSFLCDATRAVPSYSNRIEPGISGHSDGFYRA